MKLQRDWRLREKRKIVSYSRSKIFDLKWSESLNDTKLETIAKRSYGEVKAIENDVIKEQQIEIVGWYV